MSQLNQTQHSIKRTARIAGFSYIMYTLAGFYITFGPRPGFNELSDASSHLEFLFRTDLVAETILYTFVGISAAAMYALLRTISPSAAIMGAFCRLIESAMGATFIILKYAAFAAIVNPDVLSAFSDTERTSLMSLFRHLSSTAIFFLLVPMGVGGAIFFSLFFRSRYIPRWLAAWGVITYVIIACVSVFVLLFPALKEHIMLFFLPGALFEWIVALWLLFAGVNTHHWATSQS